VLNVVNLFFPVYDLAIFGYQTQTMPLSVTSFFNIKYWFFLSIAILGLNQYSAHGQTAMVKGLTLDGKTMAPLPYVSIGIKNKAVGTVADSTGKYALSYLQTEVNRKDSIFFAAVGYQTVKMVWDHYMGTDKSVKLFETPKMLETVDIRAKPLQVKNYGRSNANLIFFPAMYKNIPKQSDEKGREQATILKIDQHIFLRSLSFKINRRSFKRIKLRMNIYSVREGLPDQSILAKDVVFNVQGTTETGMPRVERVDLRPYQIDIKGQKEIAVSLAILDLEPLPGDSTRTAFFIPSFPGPLRSSLFRMKGEAEWQKVSSSNLLIALEASKMQVGKGNAEENQSDSETDTIVHSPELAKLLYGNHQGKRIGVNQAELYYETYGQGSPLFLLHGNNESISSYREQIEPLSKHFKVIALDTRGQGNSINNSTAPYTYDQFAEDLSAVMKALDIKKANLIGWSDGGNTALVFAQKHPEMVEKIVLMGANLFPGPDAIEEKVIRIFENRRDSLSQRNDPESHNQWRLANLVLKEPNMKAADLQAIDLPVLVLAGEHDVVKKQHTLLIHSSIKNSRLEIIKGADHYAPLKDPKTFNRIVLDFLAPGKRME
jgi:pimeloyl-ACP methyl ester carboxylesterase